ncbi:hypothetical protein DL96DRAFT_837236 [Flagelloscypha sp. PMI_526]|nr:hypothetical protein DL96DRAFT_837236 [Flagelloscypha sp. PMI_526]
MKELAPDGSDALDPWKFFDFIGGSGFGGIIAILLGRLKLSIPDAIEAFHRMNAGIWTTDLKSTDDASKRFSSFGIRVDEVIKKHASEEIVRLREDECCPTAILVNFSANMDAKTGATFTTYRSRETLGSPPGLLVAEAMRATAAYRRVAPDVPLKSVHEKNLPTEIRYTSADLTLPNPTSKLIQEATRHLGSSTFDLILSLGAGNPGSHGYPDAGIDLAEILEKTCRDAECEHEVVANRFRKELDNDQIPFNPYFRFNVDQGVQDRAHWLESELPGIEEHTIKHFMNVETEDQLQSLRTLREKWASSTRQEPALLMHQMMVNELR